MVFLMSVSKKNPLLLRGELPYTPNFAASVEIFCHDNIDPADRPANLQQMVPDHGIPGQ